MTSDLEETAPEKDEEASIYEIDEDHLFRSEKWEPPENFSWSPEDILKTCPVVWSTVQICLLKGVPVHGDTTSNSCESFHNTIRAERRISFPLSLFQTLRRILAQIIKVKAKIEAISSQFEVVESFQNDLRATFESSKDYAVNMRSMVRSQTGSISSYACSKTVEDAATLRRVDLVHRLCDCGYWQTILLPCVHVMVGVRLKLITLSDAIPKYLNVQQLKGFFSTYQIPFHVPPADIEPLLCIPGAYPLLKLPPVVKPKGRPKVNRYKSKFELPSSKRQHATAPSTSTSSVAKKPRKVRSDKNQPRGPRTPKAQTQTQ